MTSARYVVSRRTAGLGDLIVNLAAAWRFAKRTERTLVADWRGTFYLQDGTENLFTTLFESTDCLAGVPFVGHADLSGISYPEPYHPAFWTRSLLEGLPARPAADVWADQAAAVSLVLAGGDVDAPTVVFDGCINGVVPPPQSCREVLAGLRPVEPVRTAVNAFRAEHFGDRRVVAVHLRHGNQGKIGHHANYWTDFDAAIDRCVAAAQAARLTLGGDAVVFLATDARAAADAFLARLPETIVRSKFLRHPGEGALHRWPLAFVTREEAMIDMLLLAESDALVRFPAGSFFSFYASLMKRRPPPEVSPVQARDAGPLDPLIVW